MTFREKVRARLADAWSKSFPQKRTLERAVNHAVALAQIDNARTIAHTLSARAQDQQDWSAEYKMFSRSEWDVEQLMDEPFRYCIESRPHGPIVVAIDDTKVHKSGKKIPGVTYQRDPLSPPFHTNFIQASRYLHASAVACPDPEVGARTLPVCFRETPVLKKPGKRATAQEIAIWKEQKKTQNLSTAAVAMARDLRERADRLGGAERDLLLAVDGSFCNRTVFCQPIARVHLLARCRKDAKLARPSRERGRVYDDVKFTPEEVRKDESIAWSEVRAHYGGDWRDIRCKEINGVLWQRGAKRRLLRLIVVAAQPYRTSPNSPVNYRDEAYFLTTDLVSPLELLVQAAFDRWQIEVNHREEKTDFGVGEAQVRSLKSVPRHPAFAVATYSIIHLCALEQYGPKRTADYLQLPKWRREAKRPSIGDLKRQLQHESPMATLQSRQPREIAHKQAASAPPI